MLAVCSLLAISCSGDDDTDAAATTTPSESTARGPSDRSTTTDASSPVPTAGLPVTTLADEAPVAANDATATTATTAPSATSIASTTDVGVTSPESLPESGVPGLDSDDLFCSAWSRFGGTWQVLLVASTFLDDPERVARWEVSSAPLVVGAYDELLAQLPDELESERDALADGYFGAFERRARDARDALVDSGANGGDIAGLSEAWLAALETRDPSTPEVDFAEPVALIGLVDVASADLLARRSAFHLDPSLIVTVETPLADTYLEANCPDRGTLAGGEVDG